MWFVSEKYLKNKISETSVWNFGFVFLLKIKTVNFLVFWTAKHHVTNVNNVFFSKFQEKGKKRFQRQNRKNNLVRKRHWNLYNMKSTLRKPLNQAETYLHLALLPFLYPTIIWVPKKSVWVLNSLQQQKNLFFFWWACLHFPFHPTNSYHNTENIRL